MKPVFLDVIAPIPEVSGLCETCELIMDQAGVGLRSAARKSEDMPHDWVDDYDRLAGFLNDIIQKQGNNVVIRVFDPHSLKGLWKSLRHGVRRYPTFIVGDEQKIFGLDEEQVSKALQRAIDAARDSTYA